MKVKGRHYPYIFARRDNLVIKFLATYISLSLIKYTVKTKKWRFNLYNSSFSFEYRDAAKPSKNPITIMAGDDSNNDNIKKVADSTLVVAIDPPTVVTSAK